MRKVVLAVFSLHILFLVALVIHHLSRPSSPARKTIAVHAVVPPAPAPRPPAPPKKRPASKKPTAPVKKPNREIQKELQKSVQALEKLSAPVEIPKKELKVPEMLLVQEAPSPSYASQLSAYLQSALTLPEYGEVKVLLEIASDGSLLHCEVLEEKSSANSTFLKKRLPELHFPCFNQDHEMGSSAIFTIVFRNNDL